MTMIIDKAPLILFALGFCLALRGQQLRNEFGDVYYEPNFYLSGYSGTEGSPYLNDTFSPARINELASTHLVRFNAVEGTVEVMVADGKLVVLDNAGPYVIALADGSGKVYETHPCVHSNGSTGNSFFELLGRTPDFALYLKEEKKFFKKESAQGYASEKPARFQKAGDSYYVSDFKNASGSLLEVPSKLKPLLEFLGGDSDSVKKFIRSEKLRPDDPGDLMRILQFHMGG